MRLNGLKNDSNGEHVEDLHARVNVQIDESTRDSVAQSGSLRLKGLTAEDFIKRSEGSSPMDVLKKEVAAIGKISVDDVAIVSIIQQTAPDVIDVRFSNPNFDATQLNDLTYKFRDRLESVLGVKVLMFGVDECSDKPQLCDGSCVSRIHISDFPSRIISASTSFIGIDVRSIATCIVENSPPDGYIINLITLLVAIVSCLALIPVIFIIVVLYKKVSLRGRLDEPALGPLKSKNAAIPPQNVEDELYDYVGGITGSYESLPTVVNRQSSDRNDRRNQYVLSPRRFSSTTLATSHRESDGSVLYYEDMHNLHEVRTDETETDLKESYNLLKVMNFDQHGKLFENTDDIYSCF